MPQLRMWFYNPQQDTSGFVNKVVSRIDPPYCHCELQFNDGHACSIYMGSNVVLKQRAFESENYTAVTLECAQVLYTLPTPLPRTLSRLRVHSDRRRASVLSAAAAGTAAPTDALSACRLRGGGRRDADARTHTRRRRTIACTRPPRHTPRTVSRSARSR